MSSESPVINQYYSPSTFKTTGPWWDAYHSYYIFPHEYTFEIDAFLENNNETSTIGRHYYYGVDYSDANYTSNYIIFEKMQQQGNVYYQCYVPLFRMPTFERALSNIFSRRWNEIKTIAISNNPIVRTGSQIQLERIINKYVTPTPFQQSIVSQLSQYYETSLQHNLMVMLAGNESISYTSQIAHALKKHMEPSPFNDETETDMEIRLYDNFCPSILGLDVYEHILNYASELTPVLVVIHNIEQYYLEVMTTKHQPQQSYTRNKHSFNEMLDALGSTHYVITLFTTKQNPAELYANEQYRSFMRKGRVDYILQYSNKAEEDNAFLCIDVNTLPNTLPVLQTF